MGNRQSGLFISIEGGEGVGKTTNIEFIKQWLQQRNISYVATREPGGTELSEKIRQLLLEKSSEEMDSLAELLLVFAARAQHLAKVIRPALQQGDWVLCDRFTDATYAYQGGGRQLNSEPISKLEMMVQNDLQPDLTILLDVDPRKGLERARARAELDRFESESLDFFDRVRSTYHQRAQQFPERFALIDAGKSLECVQQDIAVVLSERLNEKLNHRSDS